MYKSVIQKLLIIVKNKRSGNLNFRNVFILMNTIGNPDVQIQNLYR
jgi:hypothetical protein